MIGLDSVTFGYRGKAPVLRDFGFSVPDGAHVRLAGASGAGKSTVLRLLMGLERPRRGKVLLPDDAAFSVVFQEDRLIPSVTVLENVALFSDEATARRLLTALGLDEVCDAMPSSLSGGMKRRVALARALAHPSDCLLLDEPFTGLDSETKEKAIALTRSESAGRTLILITHDDAEAAALTDRVVTL